MNRESIRLRESFINKIERINFSEFLINTSFTTEEKTQILDIQANIRRLIQLIRKERRNHG